MMMGSEADGGMSMFTRAGRAVYIHIDLDAIVHNTRLLKKHCGKAGIMAVLKADMYGHGAVPVARHLQRSGEVERLAVATVAEGVQLRQAGVSLPVLVFGNVQPHEMRHCAGFGLTASVSDVASIEALAAAWDALSADNQQHRAGSRRGEVHIKLDTGLHRYGCTPHELGRLVQACKDCDVHLDGIYSHFANLDNQSFTYEQMDLFDKCITPYRGEGIVFHICGSGAVLRGVGVDYDFVRSGSALIGCLRASAMESFATKGFRPSMEIKGTPTLVKRCPSRSKVGYGCTYECTEDQWLATVPLGFADGYWRCLGNNACVRRDKTGEKCPVVGSVSMDAMTIGLPCRPDANEVFTILTADFDPDTSVKGLCERAGSIPPEMMSRLSRRLPRVYTASNQAEVEIAHALDLTCLAVDADLPTSCMHGQAEFKV